MTIIYCAKDKQEQALDKLNITGSVQFKSPNDTGIVHYAHHIVVVGNHPAIEDRYRGLAKVETVTFDEEDE